MTKKLFFPIYINLILFSLSGCGGGSVNPTPLPDPTPPPPPPPPPPLACGAKTSNEVDLFNSTDGWSRLPHITVDTQSVEIIKEDKIDAFYTVTEFDSNQSPYNVSEGQIGIEIRGKTSSEFPKKSYGVETRMPDGENLNTEFLGLPKENDWIFHGPYSDKSLIRNAFVYSISNEMGRYASRHKFIDLQINNEELGTYILFEKMKRDKNRIDIKKLADDVIEGEDLTGGYIIKIDKTDADDTGTDYRFSSAFPSEAGKFHYFQYNYPKREDINNEQKNYIKNYINDFEEALNGDTYKDVATGYRNYIDVDSFIDFFILTELGNNVDGYRLSTFITKDRGEKLKMGPIWDFNLAFGGGDFCDADDYDTWRYEFNNRCPSDSYPVPFWWKKLISDPYFMGKLSARWTELRESTLSDERLLKQIDSLSQELRRSGSMENHFALWNLLSCQVWPNYFVGDTYDEEIKYLKDWIFNRTAWMDENIPLLVNE